MPSPKKKVYKARECPEESLKEHTIADLRVLADKRGVDHSGLKKADLVKLLCDSGVKVVRKGSFTEKKSPKAKKSSAKKSPAMKKSPKKASAKKSPKTKKASAKKASTKKSPKKMKKSSAKVSPAVKKAIERSESTAKHSHKKSPGKKRALTAYNLFVQKCHKEGLAKDMKEIGALWRNAHK